MAVTVYVFDKDRRVRVPLGPGDAVDLIHDENNHQITISIKASFAVRNGEYIGFNCVDGHFRLFCVIASALDDDRHMTDVTAADAIIQDMKEIIIEEKQILDASLWDMLLEFLPDESWMITGEAPDRLEKIRAYYMSMWSLVTTMEQLYEWKIDAYYQFDGGEISTRVLRMHSGEPVFRGRIFQSGRDASKAYVNATGRPITRLYGLGKSTGTEDEPKNLNFADVVWSKANGDPADKAKGQTWVEDGEAVAADGVHTDIFNAQDAETPEDLLKRTWEELQRRKNPAVTVKATVADMEMVKGYSHLQIRLGDLVAVVLKTGTIVEAKIIAIKRHYFRPWMTTITIGEKTESIQTQVSSLITSATHTFERLTIYKNRFHEDEALIQLNAEHIQLNATTILEHAEQIMLLAEENESVQLMLDGVSGTLSAQASKIIELEAADGAVALRLDAVDDSITAQANEIYLKADKTYVDNLVAQYIKAEEIEAEILSVVDSAYVMGLLSTEELDVGSLVASSVNTSWISADEIGADSISTGALSIGGDTLYKTSLTVVTGIDVVTSLEGRVTAVQPITTQFYYYT